MSEARQTTVQREVEAHGVALHTGERVRLRLRPAPADHGVVFARVDLPGAPRIAARAEATDPAALQRRTELAGPGDVRVATTEHLLSACMGLGLDNVLVELNGPEVPIFDGSVQPFVKLIEKAKLAKLNAPRRVLRLRRPVALIDGNREIIAVPAERMQLAFYAQLEHAGMPNQAAEMDVSEDGAPFRKIARARTFVFYEEVERLRQAGLIRGGSLACAIVLRDGKPVQGSGEYRLPNELACHKLLDFLGDLALLGRPLAALVTARGTGHAMHQAFLERLRKELE